MINTDSRTISRMFAPQHPVRLTNMSLRHEANDYRGLKFTRTRKKSELKTSHKTLKQRNLTVNDSTSVTKDHIKFQESSRAMQEFKTLSMLRETMFIVGSVVALELIWPMTAAAQELDQSLSSQLLKLQEQVTRLEAALNQNSNRTPSNTPAEGGQAVTQDTTSGGTPPGFRIRATYQNCLQCHQTRPTGPLPASHLEMVGTGAEGGQTASGADEGTQMKNGGMGKGMIGSGMGMGMMGGGMGKGMMGQGGRGMGMMSGSKGMMGQGMGGMGGGQTGMGASTAGTMDQKMQQMQQQMDQMQQQMHQMMQMQMMQMKLMEMQLKMMDNM